jgi:predicted protein tyrosine phosphatase
MSAVDLSLRTSCEQDTLRQLAGKAMDASLRLNDLHLPDSGWNAARAAEIRAVDAFQEQFYAATGMTPSLIRQLCDRGIFG